MKFTKALIKGKFLKRYKSFFQKEIFKHKVKGTIILSTEGINGTIAGKKDDISKIIKFIKKQFRLKDFDSMNISNSLFQPFHKGKIKIKNSRHLLKKCQDFLFFVFGI